MKRYFYTVFAFMLAACTEAPQTHTDIAWQLCTMQAVSTQTGQHSAVMDALKQDQHHCKDSK